MGIVDPKKGMLQRAEVHLMTRPWRPVGMSEKPEAIHPAELPGALGASGQATGPRWENYAWALGWIAQGALLRCGLEK